MSLSVEDRQRLAEILDENRSRAMTIGPAVGDEHAVIDEVRDLLDELAAEGKTRFKSRDIAPRTGHSAVTVGLALSRLQKEGIVEAECERTPRIWRIP